MANTFEGFTRDVKGLLADTAEGKGYNATGVDGYNQTYEFIQTATGDHGHAIGEIIYKALRYMRKRDPQDLLKIAAWAYLVFKHHK